MKKAPNNLPAAGALGEQLTLIDPPPFCPGWSVECKRHKRAQRGDVRAWWAQAVEQAERAKALPVLFFRADRDEWRAVWPASVQLTHQRAEMWPDYGWTVEGSVQAWAAVAREVQSP